MCMCYEILYMAVVSIFSIVIFKYGSFSPIYIVHIYITCMYGTYNILLL